MTGRVAARLPVNNMLLVLVLHVGGAVDKCLCLSVPYNPWCSSMQRYVGTPTKGLACAGRKQHESSLQLHQD
jgi:hypothetical protein